MSYEYDVVSLVDGEWAVECGGLISLTRAALIAKACQARFPGRVFKVRARMTKDKWAA